MATITEVIIQILAKDDPNLPNIIANINRQLQGIQAPNISIGGGAPGGAGGAAGAAGAAGAVQAAQTAQAAVQQATQAVQASMQQQTAAVDAATQSQMRLAQIAAQTQVTQAQKAARGAQQAFQGMAQEHKQAMQQVIATTDAAMQRVQQAVRATGAAAHGAGGQGGLGGFSGGLRALAHDAQAAAFTLGVITGAMGAFLRDVVQTTTNFEIYRARLQTALKDTVAAEKALNDAVVFAAKTPFDVAGVVAARTQLTIFRQDAEKLVPVAGDIAAAMGQPIEKAAQAIGRAFEGSALGVRVLTSSLGISRIQLREYGAVMNAQGGIALHTTEQIERFKNALLKIRDVQFAGGMERRMQTLGGALQNLEDAMENFKRTLGESVAPAFAFLVRGMTGSVNVLQTLPQPLLGVGAAAFTAATAIGAFAIAGVATIVVIARMQQAVTALQGAAAGAAGTPALAQGFLNVALGAGRFLLIAGGVVVALAAIFGAAKLLADLFTSGGGIFNPNKAANDAQQTLQAQARAFEEQQQRAADNAAFMKRVFGEDISSVPVRNLQDMGIGMSELGGMIERLHVKYDEARAQMNRPWQDPNVKEKFRQDAKEILAQMDVLIAKKKEMETPPSSESFLASATRAARSTTGTTQVQGATFSAAGLFEAPLDVETASAEEAKQRGIQAGEQIVDKESIKQIKERVSAMREMAKIGDITVEQEREAARATLAVIAALKETEAFKKAEPEIQRAITSEEVALSNLIIESRRKQMEEDKKMMVARVEASRERAQHELQVEDQIAQHRQSIGLRTDEDEAVRLHQRAVLLNKIMSGTLTDEENNSKEVQRLRAAARVDDSLLTGDPDKDARKLQETADFRRRVYEQDADAAKKGVLFRMRLEDEAHENLKQNHQISLDDDVRWWNDRIALLKAKGPAYRQELLAAEGKARSAEEARDQSRVDLEIKRLEARQRAEKKVLESRPGHTAAESIASLERQRAELQGDLATAPNRGSASDESRRTQLIDLIAKKQGEIDTARNTALEKSLELRRSMLEVIQREQAAEFDLLKIRLEKGQDVQDQIIANLEKQRQLEIAVVHERLKKEFDATQQSAADREAYNLKVAESERRITEQTVKKAETLYNEMRDKQLKNVRDLINIIESHDKSRIGGAASPLHTLEEDVELQKAGGGQGKFSGGFRLPAFRLEGPGALDVLASDEEKKKKAAEEAAKPPIERLKEYVISLGTTTATVKTALEGVGLKFETSVGSLQKAIEGFIQSLPGTKSGAPGAEPGSTKKDAERAQTDASKQQPSPQDTHEAAHMGAPGGLKTADGRPLDSPLPPGSFPGSPGGPGAGFIFKPAGDGIRDAAGNLMGGFRGARAGTPDIGAWGAIHTTNIPVNINQQTDPNRLGMLFADAVRQATNSPNSRGMLGALM